MKISYPINLIRIFWWNIFDKGSDKSTGITVRPFQQYTFFLKKSLHGLELE